jgi:hypothetical protein
MRFGPMILISQLSHVCACFIALKRNKLRSLRFCLSLYPKHILPKKFAKTFPLFECIKAYGQNRGCETIAKKIASLDGQLCER